MKTIYNQVNLIAHRGLSGEYCENTLPAFVHACKYEFFGIETDIQFTKDNKIVCFHDKSLKRLGCENVEISDINYKELMKKPLFAFDSTYKICSFKDYLKTCKKYKKYCVIEIKYKVSERQLKMLISKIKWHRYLKKCIIISFNSNILRYLRMCEPNLQLQLLVNNPIKHYVDFCKKFRIDVSLYERIIKKDTISKLKSHGIKVGVWTVNNKIVAQKFINKGASYITSNILLS